MCQRMLEMSLARARDRVTFGKTINTRQAIKMKLADMATATHAPVSYTHLDQSYQYLSNSIPIHRIH